MVNCTLIMMTFWKEYSIMADVKEKADLLKLMEAIMKETLRIM